jgi:hypothetical protein
MLHGSTRTTADIDILYRRTRENVQRMVEAVKPFHPKLRPARNAAPVDFPFDEQTISNGANFAL